MIRIPPYIAYTFGIVLTCWLIIGLVTISNATRWFQQGSASIQQDFVALSPSSVSLNNAKVVHGQWNYHDHIVSSENAPDPPEQGLQGIMYDRGQFCSDKDLQSSTIPANIAVFSNVPKIALITRGGCQFSQKLLNAQNDGASAAIMYGNVSLNNNDSSRMVFSMDLDPNTVHIPAYFVDTVIGSALYDRLENMTKSNSELRGNNREVLASKDSPTNADLLVTRVTLYPPQKPALESWQFALILIGVVFGTSVAILLIIQFHLWRVSQRAVTPSSESLYQEMDHHPDQDRAWHVIMGTTSPRLPHHVSKKHQCMDPDQVALIPTRVYGELSEKHSLDEDTSSRDSRTEKNEPDQFSDYASKATSLCSLPSHHSAHSHQSAHSHHSARSVHSVHSESSHSGCTICLDAYIHGDVLRHLPCQHEFHKNCIDKWLINKRECCPLCLQRVQVEGSTNDPQQQDDIEPSHHLEEPDLASTWRELSRQPSVSRRRLPLDHPLVQMWMGQRANNEER